MSGLSGTTIGWPITVRCVRAIWVMIGPLLSAALAESVSVSNTARETMKRFMLTPLLRKRPIGRRSSNIHFRDARRGFCAAQESDMRPLALAHQGAHA